MLTEPSAELDSALQDYVWKYNLHGDWYVTLKAILFERGLLRSAEQVQRKLESG